MKTLLAMVAGSVSLVLVALFLYMAVKSVCHECLTFPMAAVCERRGGAVDVEMESNRIGGYIKERQFAGCVFYWHEANSGAGLTSLFTQRRRSRRGGATQRGGV